MMDGRIEQVLGLLCGRAGGVSATGPAFDEECRQLWRRLAVRETESAVARWQVDPGRHVGEVMAALERLVAADDSSLDRLRHLAIADGTLDSSKLTSPELAPAGSTGVTVGQNQGGVIAGGDVQLTGSTLANTFGNSSTEEAAPSANRPVASRSTPSHAVPFGGEASSDEASLKILFLSANPDNSTRLRLDKEVRAIDGVLRLTEHGARVHLEQQWAVQVGDLQDSLLRHKPTLVHFSGHGSVDSLLLEDAGGQAHSVPGKLLERLFGMFREHVRCVVLNCCHSADQADAIASIVDCVVGMATTVSDQGAIRFAVGFYRGLAGGRSVEASFEHGCLEAELFEPGQGDIPKLICPRADPARLILLPDQDAGPPTLPGKGR